MTAPYDFDARFDHLLRQIAVANYLDFLFGRKILKKVADDQPKPAPQPSDPVPGYVQQQVEQQERLKREKAQQASEKSKHRYIKD